MTGAGKPYEPTHCDVCHQKLDDTAEYRPMTIVRDSTPRQLRVERGGGFIEDEWRLEAVCGACNEKFEIWLFGDPLSFETVFSPAGDEVDSTRERLGDTLGVEESPASNAAEGVDP